MSGSNKKFYLPAGYSSSEDEFSENDEDEENISYSNPKVVQATVQLAAAAPLINSQFVWTRDTCAKRAVDFCSKSETEETDRKQAVSEKRTDSKTLKDVQSGEDCAMSKPSKKKAVAAGAGSGLSDLINWSWVDKIIKDEANTSSAFQGSKEVDQMWLNRIACASKQQKGNLQGMVKQLCDCWKEVINPHSTTLFMLENMNVFEGKKPNILISLLKAFDQWLTKSSDTKTGHLSHSIQLRAFALLIREPVPVPHGVDLLSKCYQLNQLTDHAPFLTLIHQILEKKTT